jgi:hypothetical protein
MDNVVNFVADDKLLVERYLTLFWNPCGTHCIVSILEDMGEISYIMDIIGST